MGGFGNNFGTNFAGSEIVDIPPVKTVVANLCVTESIKEDLCV